MNLPTILFQHLRDIVRDTRHGSKRTKIYIPMGRMISYVLMESQLIESLTYDQFCKGMEPLTGRMLNAKVLKNMRIITEMVGPPSEFPNDTILNRRIPLKVLPIFSKPYPRKKVVKFLEKCHVDAFLAASEAISRKNKRKTAKKHFESMANQFKAFREQRDTYARKTRASKATSAGTASGMIAPYEARCHTIVYNSSISTTTPLSSISLPYTSL